MVNTAKLKGLIVERGTTQQTVADALEIDRSTFYRKLKKGGTFTVGEANKRSSTFDRCRSNRNFFWTKSRIYATKQRTYVRRIKK